MADAQEAQLFIDYFVTDAAPTWKALAQARWQLATTGERRYKEELVALKQREHQLYEDEGDWERVQAFYQARAQLGNPLLSREIEVLHRTFLNNQSTAEENKAIVGLEADVQEIFYNYRPIVGDRQLNDNEIATILQGERDEQVRREAWEGSKRIGRQVAAQIRDLAHRRNAVARRLGFRDHYDFSLQRQEIDEATLFDLFARLEKQTDDAFRRSKADVDRRLHERLGLSDGESLQPWHYADPFFQEVPSVFEADLNELFANVDIAELSVRAYDGMGMEVRDILERSDLYERNGKNQHAFCIRIDREGDTRILCNLRPNTRWMTTQMHELGHAIYNKSLPLELPYLVRTPAHTNSTEAIAMLMGRLPRNAQWLVQVAGGDPQAVESVQTELGREMTAAQLIFVRWVLVMLHFEQALYADPNRPDLNDLWWQLVSRYQLVRRPDREAGEDWAAKYHVALAPVYYHNYVLGELTTSQLERWIEREVGSLVDNPAAGELLANRFFVHGARYSWDELIEVATGETLNPDYFVSQFAGNRVPV